MSMHGAWDGHPFRPDLKDGTVIIIIIIIIIILSVIRPCGL
jgi:hypothetical protein